MKTAQIRAKITEANNLVGCKIYDCRYNDFYTILTRKAHFYSVDYTKRGILRTPVTEVFFYLNAKQHILN